MSDLISRDALHKVWCANCDNKHLCGGKVGCDEVKELYDMPTIEAEPIVRCKDCKYCITHEKILFCEYMGNIGDWRFRTETDFCSRGAKMDEVEE